MSLRLWFNLVIDEGDGAGRYWEGMCMIPLGNLKSRITCNCLLRLSIGGQFNVLDILVMLPCVSAYLTQTMSYNAASFLTYGLMIAGEDPI